MKALTKAKLISWIASVDVALCQCDWKSNNEPRASAHHPDCPAKEPSTKGAELIDQIVEDPEL